MPGRRVRRDHASDIYGDEPASEEIMERLRAACERHERRAPKEGLTHKEATQALNALQFRGMRIRRHEHGQPEVR